MGPHSKPVTSLTCSPRAASSVPQSSCLRRRGARPTACTTALDKSQCRSRRGGAQTSSLSGRGDWRAFRIKIHRSACTRPETPFCKGRGVSHVAVGTVRRPLLKHSLYGHSYELKSI
ncbi:hypothetical protein XA68_12004 [Ophiocordyceps unilateralis]|uniref:Uncharacterized protein n=1 Tax=Ophiocordyceps unilateralis TaxID=268505 RepID=A0A2A9PP04_OPHUN|nr:hypothetical protein XA68_12004 [Ophiocordyceps unilateralis]